MTTLVGIKAGNGDGKGGVVLGSDMSRTHTSWTPQGDVAYRSQRRIEGQKIYVSHDRELALCMTGAFDDEYSEFLSRVIEGDIDFYKAIESGNFQELRTLNLKRMGDRFVNPDAQSGLLIATKYTEPELYTCFPLGGVERRNWTSAGSGSDYALKYIAESGRLIPRGINIGDAIDLTVGALDKASQDLYTGGLDMVVINREDIFDLGSGIRRDIETARANSIEQAKKRFAK